MAAQYIPVSPSQRWDGDYGSWSTFSLQVGDSSTNYRILPATGQETVWLVLPGACSIPQAPSQCSDLRGNTFQPNDSSTYKPLNDHWTMHGLPVAEELPLNPNETMIFGYGAYIGYDTISLGTEGNNGGRLPGQVIASYESSNPYLGQLGLQAYNSSIVNNDTQYSVLGYLSHTNAIPSAMWAYTAGSQGRGIFGSLTLGGYDAARGNTENVLTSALAMASDRDIQVSLTGIRIGSTDLNIPSPMTYLIDSMVPELWLPGDQCDQFANVYGLTWNDTLQLYTLNSTRQAFNQATNVSVTLSLAALGNSTQTTEITMPYSSFDMQASWPVAQVNQSIPYFPLKRATNSTQWFLGRAFLQDAYLAVNYGTGEFNLSQALTPPDSHTDYVTVVNHGPSPSNPHGLSGGAIAGIVVGILAAVAIVLGVIFWDRRRRRDQRQRRREKEQELHETLQENLQSPRSRGTTIVAEEPPVHEHFKPFLSGAVEADGQEKDVKPELHGESRETYELYAGDVVSELSGAYVSPQGERVRSPMTTRSESFDTMSPPLSDQTTPPIGPEFANDSTGRSWFGGPFELPNSPRPHHDRRPSSLSQPSVREEEASQERAHPPLTSVSPVREQDDFEDDVSLRGTRNTLMTPNDLATRVQFVNHGDAWDSATIERQYHVVNSEGLVPDSPDPTVRDFPDVEERR